MARTDDRYLYDNSAYQHMDYSAGVDYDDEEGVAVSTGNWVLTIFLLGIPVVNIILLIVWAVSSSTPKSKRNYARATLIWMLIGIVIVGAIIAGVYFWLAANFDLNTVTVNEISRAISTGNYPGPAPAQVVA